MNKTNRYGELDLIRGFALLLMMVQHCQIVWNFVFVGKPTAENWAESVGRIGALLFLLLVGVSGYLSFSFKEKQSSFAKISTKFLKRGTFLMGWGFVISLLTIFAIPYAPIYFGVLSFIGLNVILLPYFIKYQPLSWLFIFTAPVVGYFVSTYHPETLNWLLFGVYPSYFSSLDYWPLFPWITIVLLGVELARRLYKNGKRQFSVKEIKNISVLTWIGSHTLLLYLLHIPVLYVLFTCVKYLVF